MAAPSNITNASIPQAGIPFLDQGGNVSRPWLYFFLSLFNKTGGNTPVVPSTTLQQQIDALSVEIAMADVEFPPLPPVPPGTGAWIGEMLADVPIVTRPALNPILAALMVAD